MNVIGIKCHGHDTGAAILCENNGQLTIHAISEARLNRYKHSYQFPLMAIKYCLEAANLNSINDIDHLGVDIHTDQLRSPQRIKNETEKFYQFDQNDKRNFCLFHSFNLPKEKVSLVDHITAHAASAYYLSPFDKASILVVDGGFGIYAGNNNNLECIDEIGYRRTIKDRRLINHVPFMSTARLFEEITYYLGYTDGSFSAGKTMGLASYGHTVPQENYFPVLDNREHSSFINYIQTIKWIRTNLKKFDRNKTDNNNATLLNPKS